MHTSDLIGTTVGEVQEAGFVPEEEGERACRRKNPAVRWSRADSFQGYRHQFLGPAG